MVADVPGMREEFERVGGGAVLNNTPYDLAASVLMLEEAGAVVSDAYGRPLGPNRLLGSDAGVPDVDRRQRQPRPARFHPAGDRRWHLAPTRVTSPRDGRRQPRCSLTIPAKPGYLVLARLALSAVCRLTPLDSTEVADLKLAVTEAANDFVDEETGEDEQVDFDFRLHDDKLVLQLEGSAASPPPMEQELSRAIIEATVDESTFSPGPHRPGEADLMLQPIAVGHKSLADYTHVAGKPLIEEIRELSAELEGLKVLHLSATAFGGGVSEILYTLVPLMNDVGIDAQWQIMLGREEFYNVTKLLHNALQGNPQGLSAEEWQIFANYNEMNAAELTDGLGRGDHPRPPAGRDPAARAREGEQLGVALPHRPLHAQRDGDRAAGAAGARLRRRGLPPPGLRPAGMDGTPIHICPPAIDPLSPKNMAFSPEDAAYVCDQFGIDVDRPLMCQVSRFDPWKDPMGVIDAYRLVKEEMPEVQLALIGSMATDDPEGWEFFNQTMAHADGDPDVHILNNLNNVGAIEVNAFQSQADVVIQKSTREGFGLTVSEALWKARPFIGGDVGGIPLQVEDGETGYLVSSPEECAERSLGDPARARPGQAAGAGGQGARARALPHPAPAARLAAYLQGDLQ